MMKRKSNVIRDAMKEGRLVLKEQPIKRRSGRPKMPEGTAITEKELITLTKREKTALEVAMVKGHFPSMSSLLRYIVASYAKHINETDLKVISDNWDWERQEKDDKYRTNVLKQGNLLEPIGE